MSEIDQHHGQGGSYVVRDGKRDLVRDSRTKDSAGGGARDKDGKALDVPAKDAKPEPALPAPQGAPWAAPAEAAPAASGDAHQASGKSDRKGA